MAYPSWLELGAPAPPVDPALAGPPLPPWLQPGPPVGPDMPNGVPAPYVNLAEAPTPPPGVAPELAGPPGAPPPASDRTSGLPPWMTGDPVGMDASRAVPEVETGNGLGLQHRPTVNDIHAKNAPTGKAGVAREPKGDQSRVVHGRRPMSYADMVLEQANQEQGLAQRVGDIEAQKADALAQGKQRAADFERESIEDQQRTEMANRKDLATREAALEAERQAIANTKIDPNAWYASRSEGQKAGIMIGMGIGGYLSVTTGSGRNDFAEWMDGQIQNDLEAQKATLANRQDALGQGMSLYGQMRARYQDERTADAMFAAAKYDNIGHQAMAQAAQFDSPLAKENANLIALQSAQKANGLIQAAAQYDQEFALKKREVGISAFNAQTSRRNSDWGQEKDIADLALEYERLGLERRAAHAAAEQDVVAASAAKDMDVKNRVIYRPDGKPMRHKDGSPVLAGNVEQAAAQRGQLTSTWAFRRQLQEYLDFTEAAGNEFSGIPGLSKTDALARAKSMYAGLMFKTKSSEKTGALDKGMVEVFSTYVDEPETWLGAQNPTASARTGLDQWQKDTNLKYKIEYGYEGSFVDDFDRETGQDPGAVARAERNKKVSGAKNAPTDAERKANSDRLQRERDQRERDEGRVPLADRPADEETIEQMGTTPQAGDDMVKVHTPSGVQSIKRYKLDGSGASSRHLELMDGTLLPQVNPPPGRYMLKNGRVVTIGTPDGEEIVERSSSGTVNVHSGSGVQARAYADIASYQYDYVRMPDGSVVSVSDPPPGVDVSKGKFFLGDGAKR